MKNRLVIVGIATVLVVTGFGVLRAAEPRLEQTAMSSAAELAAHRALLDRYCVGCHNERTVGGRDAPASPLVSQLRAVGLTLDTMEVGDVGAHADKWEAVVRKLRGGVMPPAGRPAASRPRDAGAVPDLA